jgi:hypothetical protein
MLVWLTDWQLAEDHLLIKVGEAVDWQLYPADAEWTTRLFAHRLVIEWQFDTYGAAADQPSCHAVGVVERLQRVWSRQIRTDDGIVPVRGEATLEDALDTSASWSGGVATAEVATGPDAGITTLTGAFPDFTDKALYGYVLSLALKR